MTIQTTFAISYAVLWGFVVLEAVVLRETLRRTLWFTRRYSVSTQKIELVGLPHGAAAPDFSARLLGTGKMLRKAELEGHSTILLFVSPTNTSLPDHKLAVALHVWWHRVDGHIYLICIGSEQACCQHGRDLQIHGSGDLTPMIVDEDGQIARSFKIDDTPVAVELDEDLRILRYGWPAEKNKNGEEREGRL
ncbi:MAG TPA: hypothetical protein VJX30_07480 [Terriglobales bacterium]|nr:hypothetical protein [Terriglobales bacterium]